MISKSLWRCPSCGREFSNKNQGHSCASYTIDEHFQDKSPWLREAFDLLLAHLKEHGPIRVDPAKTVIHLAGRSHFAVVHVRKSGMNLEFLSDTRLADPRIVRTQQPGDNLYIHWVKLVRNEDVDEQLLGWLKEAYSLKR